MTEGQIDEDTKALFLAIAACDVERVKALVERADRVVLSHRLYSGRVITRIVSVVYTESLAFTILGFAVTHLANRTREVYLAVLECLLAKIDLRSDAVVGVSHGGRFTSYLSALAYMAGNKRLSISFPVVARFLRAGINLATECYYYDGHDKRTWRTGSSAYAQGPGRRCMRYLWPSAWRQWHCSRAATALFGVRRFAAQGAVRAVPRDVMCLVVRAVLETRFAEEWEK